MYEAKFGDGAGGSGGAVLKTLLWLERQTLKHAQVVITTNQSHKTVAIERGGANADDIYIVRSGPQLARFKRYPPDPAWRKGRKHLLVYLGEICKQDGVDHLIRAIKHLVEDRGFRDFHCVLVGGGPHQPAIKAYAGELGVDEWTTFTGRISDEMLCRVLSSADIAVDPDPKNPWTDKSTMNKIVEYMFFGLPIVSSDLTEARFSAGEAALYVTPGDPRDMARGIATLLDDPVRRQAMSAFGKARLRNTVAFEYSIPHLLAAYDAAWACCRRGAAGRGGLGYRPTSADLSG